MSSEESWAAIVGAVMSPETAPSRESRALLLQDALVLAVEVIPPIVACSVTEIVQTDQGVGYRTPVASNQTAVELDQVQYTVDDGPCVAACRDGRTHGIAVMDDEQAFARFTAAAADRGVRSSLSLPLRRARPTALNLYAGEPNAFADPLPLAGAAFLARCVSGLLPDATRLPEPRAMSAANEQRRELVRRACALLTERDGASPGWAFHRLTVLSRERQLSAFDVARAIVDVADVGQRS